MTDLIEAIVEPGIPWMHDHGIVLAGRSLELAAGRLLLDIALPDGTSTAHCLDLGDEVMIGDRRWRFEDVSIRTPSAWTVTLRRAEPGSPPFVPPPLTGDRVWNTVELTSSGPVGEDQIVELERALGRRLPPIYRGWLAQHNGVTPVEPVWIPGRHFSLAPWHPLLGIHPETPHLDLRTWEREREWWFTDEFIVIGVVTGGILAVETNTRHLDRIVGLYESDTGTAPGSTGDGDASAAEHRCRELIVPLASCIRSFCAELQPAPKLPPATLTPTEHPRGPADIPPTTPTPPAWRESS